MVCDFWSLCIDFWPNLWYNNGREQNILFVFLLSRPAGFFSFINQDTTMKLPKFIRDLLSSPSYMDKDSNEYVSAEKYLRMLFPGVMLPDATGRLVPPEYDMTLDQFNAVQSELESSMEEAIEDAEGQMDDSLDIEQFIELEETIDVRVLMPAGGVVEMQLEIYVLDIPDGAHNMAPDKSRMIYRWHSEDGENTCDECASRDGEIYTNESDIPEIPVHPNCRCSITQDEVDATGQPIRSKPYTPKTKEEKNEIKKDVKNMKISDKGLEWLKKLEGFVKVDGKHVIYDDATGRPVPNGTPLPAGATIGYGHLIKSGEDFSKGLTEKDATALFQRDLQSTYDTIAKQIDHDVLAAMPQHKYDALVALVFNIGPGSAAPENVNRGLYQSTIRKYINDKDFRSNTYPTPESAWKAFRNHGYLDSRRDAEWRLYQNNDYSGY